MFCRTAALTFAVLVIPAPSLWGEDTSIAFPENPALPTRPVALASHPSSPALLRNIAFTLPTFKPQPAPAAVELNRSAALTSREPPVMLPKFLVREPRPIDEHDVMTDKAREDAIVKRYVGKPAGLDVALNKFTLNTLWKKIPLLGRNSDFASVGGPSMTYSQRITLDYSKIEARRRYIEALGINADVPPLKPAAGKKPLSEDGK